MPFTPSSQGGVSEGGFFGHLVLRLMDCLVLFYTSRVNGTGRLTMDETVA
jgi:hypothetical protein